MYKIMQKTFENYSSLKFLGHKVTQSNILKGVTKWTNQQKRHH